MNKLSSKATNVLRRQNRVRTLVRGTAVRPRLSVNISNSNVSAQIIDDSKQTTIASATTVNTKTKGSLSDKAVTLGKDIAKKAKAKKVSKVVFDRGPKKYHGRIKALADAAREEGLKF